MATMQAVIPVIGQGQVAQAIDLEHGGDGMRVRRPSNSPPIELTILPRY
jgi:hypothetical protein